MPLLRMAVFPVCWWFSESALKVNFSGKPGGQLVKEWFFKHNAMRWDLFSQSG